MHILGFHGYRKHHSHRQEFIVDTMWEVFNTVDRQQLEITAGFYVWTQEPATPKRHLSHSGQNIFINIVREWQTKRNRTFRCINYSVSVIYNHFQATINGHKSKLFISQNSDIVIYTNQLKIDR